MMDNSKCRQRPPRSVRLTDDMGLDEADDWHVLPAGDADLDAGEDVASGFSNEALFYIRAIPERCKATGTNGRTGEVQQLLTPEGARILCLMVGTKEALDFIAYMDEKEALHEERVALMREMADNARVLSRRRKIPRDVYQSIRKTCQKALDAKRRRDNAQMGLV
ncbi:hypothetical protein pqer_cds_1156 [Pandoravirus quercus]|uniref:Uncharacterized protein n=2 Tax=Pandoravirus TaxID=2060084 RepID=A0A2U7UAU9_9VIRU|nr:hypothetical protein pqer_cds_1156 [Pandoravirus quercus]AVK75578.1 hypothetical protein pqer_cds_1156 [Pandoravirus quercus]QBZ81755.1 hypothetical protein pclt_cds_1174 [Pandoravirus celtis]